MQSQIEFTFDIDTDMVSIFSKISGISKLVNYFESKAFPNEKEILKTTLQVGNIRYRKCGFIFMDDEGFYLSIKMIFKKYPVIFIPWSSIIKTKKERLYGRKAIQLDFEDSTLPSIKIYETDFRPNYYKPESQPESSFDRFTGRFL